MSSISDKAFDIAKKKAEELAMERMKTKMRVIIDKADYEDTVILHRLLTQKKNIIRYFELNKTLERMLG
jgi:hypothetical protein